MKTTSNHQESLSANAIQRLPHVLAAQGIQRSQHYKNIAAGLFTPGVKLGPRATGWPAHEVLKLVSARIAGKSPDQIKALVQTLVVARSTLA